ncbi:MAG: radical SAM protein [Patescibacteria group bacterium]
MFIHPHKTRFRFQLKRIGMPSGILQLAACLEEAGISVAFLDAAAEGFENEHLTGEVSPIDGEPILRYGLEIEEILNRIAAVKPAIIGLSSLTTSQSDVDVELGRAIKKAFPEITVVTGGYHASTKPEQSLATGAFDYLVKGEGEIAFTSLVKSLLGGDPPKERVVQGQPVINLDSLPLPAYHLVRNIQYGGERFHGGKARNTKVAEVFTTRGCPYNCDFCAVETVHGHNHRAYSLEYVRRLFDKLMEEGYKEVVIEDDNFMANPKRAVQIAELLHEARLDWTAIGGIGIRQLTVQTNQSLVVNQELIQKMAACGCYRIYLAVESASRETLRSVNKGNLYCDPKIAEQVVMALNSAGIEVYGGFMIGFPSETMEDVEKTVRYAARLRECGMKCAVLFFVTPLPGTALGQQLEKAIVGCQADYCYERSNYNSPHIKAKTLNRERRRLLIIANGPELVRAWESGGPWPT